MRLDLVLIARHPELSRRRAREVIEKGQVTLAGALALDAGAAVAEDADISWDPNRRALSRARCSLPILYQDDSLLVLDKPAGLLAVPTSPEAADTEDTVLRRAQDYMRHLRPASPYVGVVHRLDRDTTGAMAFALSERDRAVLRALFREHRLERRYVALVRGEPTAESGAVDLPIRDSYQSGRREVAREDDEAKPALTHWRVLERFAGAALLELQLQTGRQHQIRLHLSHIGLPILGDAVYGQRREREAPAAIPTGARITNIPAPRQMLHARILALTIPLSGAQVRVEAPLPADFLEVLGLLRKARRYAPRRTAEPAAVAAPAPRTPASPAASRRPPPSRRDAPRPPRTADTAEPAPPRRTSPKPWERRPPAELAHPARPTARRARPLMRRLTWAALALLVVVVLALALLPPYLERDMNRLVGTALPQPSDRARVLHPKLRISDLHADTLLWSRDPLERASRGHVDLPRLVEGNVTLQAFTVATKSPRGLNYERNDDQSDQITLLAMVQRWPPRTWSSLLQRALYASERIHRAAADSGGRLTMVHDAGELERFLARREKEPGIVGGFLGLEGSHAIEGDLDNVDALSRAGYLMAAPTHFFDTDLAGSAHGVTRGGLTPKGREWVKRMEARSMIVDLAHASPTAFGDAVAMARRPVLVSHTGVRGTCDRTRNLSDDQLRAVARTGGIVGIGFWDEAVCGSDPASIARAIRHAATVMGVEHVALGSDFDGAVTTPFDAAGLVHLTDALLAAGFSDGEVAQVMGGNTLRLLAATLPR